MVCPRSHKPGNGSLLATQTLVVMPHTKSPAFFCQQHYCVQPIALLLRQARVGYDIVHFCNVNTEKDLLLCDITPKAWVK